jgi:hypothetical protein
MYWVYLKRQFLPFFVYKTLTAAAPASTRRAAPSMPKRAAAPVAWGAELPVAEAACEEAWLPAAAVPETMLVCMLELARAAEVLEAAEAVALALALAPPLSSEAPSMTDAEMKATSLPDKTAVCVS